MKLNESIMKNLSETYDEKTDLANMNSFVDSIKNILEQCNADISFVNFTFSKSRVDINCSFKSDYLSKESPSVSLYGSLWVNDKGQVFKADIKTGSGPNILNYDFIRCLNALYGFISSGNKHYEL